MLVLACVCWGWSFPAWKALDLWWRSQDAGAGSVFTSVWGLSLRFLIAGLLLVLVLAIFRRLLWPNSKEWQQAGEMALLTSLGMGLQMDALAYTPASTSAFLTQGYAILLPLVFAVRLRRWPHPLIWLAVIMVVIGGGILAGVRPGALALGRGELETLLASVVMTAQILNLESPRFAGNNSLRMTVPSLLITGLILAVAAFVLTPSVGALFVPFRSGSSLSVLLSLAVICTLGGMVLMFVFQSRVGAVTAGITYCSEPVFASLMALVAPGLLSTCLGITYANEEITPSLLWGGCLVLLAILIIQFLPRPVSPASVA